MSAPFTPPVLVRLVPVGDDMGIVLSDAVLAHLGVARGDSVDVEQTDGGLVLRRHRPTHDEKMQAADAIMDEDQDILRVVAQ